MTSPVLPPPPSPTVTADASHRRYRIHAEANLVAVVDAAMDVSMWITGAIQMAFPTAVVSNIIVEPVFEHGDLVRQPRAVGGTPEYGYVVQLPTSGNLVVEYADGTQVPLQEAQVV
jgi:hypothetical protein